VNGQEHMLKLFEQHETLAFCSLCGIILT